MPDETENTRGDSNEQPTIPPQSKTTDAARLNSGDATIPPQNSDVKKAPDRVKPTIEGYELLEELGRGGMGVVYKARNLKLDRLVAIKMIIGGLFASEEQIQRFTHEAESVAKLDHPGIVPIYEIGESQGNHFFAMKLIEGAALDGAQESFANDQRKIASLMATIANAVHHAHQRGILHRDLKPANILLDQDGDPLVTDLGLAKQIDDDDGMTKTGSVMGSPGFMSPEQASGKSDVTTSVDIYSLGAILYWMVTGRPPVEGDTHLDVILKTVSEEPKRLQVLAPNADRSLNLICQKALAKDPKDRYDSAADFASDLQAWLDGEPISVKPPSALGLAQHWLKRNARTILSAGGIGLLCGALVGGTIFLLIVADLLQDIHASEANLGDAGSVWVTEYFSWVSLIPHGLLNLLPMMIVLLTVSFGIASIGLVKPKSREVGMVIATTAALVAGIAAFMLSLGWSPIIRHGLAEGANDISLISNAFWMEQDERKLAETALLQRYPGLTRVAPERRGDILSRKIRRDQILGIPKGMWVGIGDTLFLGVLPLFLASTFSGLVWHQGERGFSFLGKSVELAIYSALFCLLMTKCVSNSTGLYPGFWYQLITCGGVLVGLLIGLADRHVALRIFAFVLVNICLFANFYESGKISRAGTLAARAESIEDYQEAAYYHQKLVDVNPNEATRFRLATLYLYLGEEEKYGQQCKLMISEFENAYRPNVAERLAKVCMLKPEVVGHQEEMYALSESVSGYKTATGSDWLYLCRAISELRQTHFQEALDWSEKSRQKAGDMENERKLLNALCHIVDALAYQGLGDETKSVESAELCKTTLAKADRSNPNWQDRLIVEILLREWNGR